MASCKLCDLLSDGGRDGTAISEDKKIDHAKVHWNQNKFIDGDDQRTLEEILEACFGEKISAENGGEEESTDLSHHPTLQAHCRQIFGNRPKNPRVACNLCHSGIKLVKTGGHLQASAIIDHASIHLDAKQFECVHCSQRLCGKYAAIGHVKRVHGVKNPTSEDYMDQSNEFHDQMVDTIKKCFVGCRQATMSDEDRKSTRAANSIRSHNGASKYVTERQLLCHRLIRKADDDTEGKIECHACSKRILVKYNGELRMRYAINHVERHLKKPIYQCNVCAKPLSTYGAVRDHLRKKHAMASGNNYEDNSDKYHAEIMAMLLECFEEKPPSAQSQQPNTKRRHPKMVEKVAPIHRGSSIGSASSSGIGKPVKTATSSSTALDLHRRTTATNSSAMSPLALTDSLEKKKSEKDIRKRPHDGSNHDRGSSESGSSPISARSIASPSKKMAAKQTDTGASSITLVASNGDQ